jgi:hypothetical protein
MAWNLAAGGSVLAPRLAGVVDAMDAVKLPL